MLVYVLLLGGLISIESYPKWIGFLFLEKRFRKDEKEENSINR